MDRPTTLEERLRALIAPLKQELEQLEAHRAFKTEEHQTQIAKLREVFRKEMDESEANIKKLQSALRHLDPTTEVPKATKPRRTTKNQSHVGRPRSNGTATGLGISVEAVKPFVDEIKRVVAERSRDGSLATFTQKEIYRGIDHDQSKGSAAFKYLRQIEFLRKAGRNPESRAEVWSIMDADAYDAVLTGLASAAQEEVNRLKVAKLDSDEEIERVAAFIREQGEVQGWNAVIEGAKIAETRLTTIRHRLVDADLIEVKQVGGKGKPVAIRWKSQEGMNLVAA